MVARGGQRAGAHEAAAEHQFATPESCLVNSFGGEARTRVENVLHYP